MGDNNGRLPIHYLCNNRNLDDTASLDILQFVLDIDPTLSREVGDDGYVPIRIAIRFKSTAFCKILIDAYPESLRIESHAMLPIHLACSGVRDDSVDTIQYMLELDPELINSENRIGYLPIHLAAERGRIEAIELLLKFDPDAASNEVNDGTRRLPLHLACAAYNPNLSSIQVLYDAYPDAIFASDGGRQTPLDLALAIEYAIFAPSDGARQTPLDPARNQLAIEFLQTQIEYAEQSRNAALVDENGQSPLHRALKENAPLGSIKLLVMGQPSRHASS